MVHAESSRIVELVCLEGMEIDIETYTHLTEAINDFAEDELIKPENFHNVHIEDELVDKTRILLAGKIELLRDTGTEADFAEFERRLTLAAIDELWMQHIDRMAHLREEVAFEGYAQKNPLVVYKERAYSYFVEMI